jgi:hypothetical protein
MHPGKTLLACVLGMGSLKPHLHDPHNAYLVAHLMHMQPGLFAPTSVNETSTIGQVNVQQETQNTKISFKRLLVKMHMKQ